MNKDFFGTVRDMRNQGVAAGITPRWELHLPDSFFESLWQARRPDSECCTDPFSKEFTCQAIGLDIEIMEAELENTYLRLKAQRQGVWARVDDDDDVSTYARRDDTFWDDFDDHDDEAEPAMPGDSIASRVRSRRGGDSTCGISKRHRLYSAIPDDISLAHAQGYYSDSDDESDDGCGDSLARAQGFDIDSDDMALARAQGFYGDSDDESDDGCDSLARAQGFNDGDSNDGCDTMAHDALARAQGYDSNDDDDTCSSSDLAAAPVHPIVPACSAFPAAERAAATVGAATERAATERAAELANARAAAVMCAATERAAAERAAAELAAKRVAKLADAAAHAATERAADELAAADVCAATERATAERVATAERTAAAVWSVTKRAEMVAAVAANVAAAYARRDKSTHAAAGDVCAATVRATERAAGICADTVRAGGVHPDSVRVCTVRSCHRRGARGGRRAARARRCLLQREMRPPDQKRSPLEEWWDRAWSEAGLPE